MPILTMIVAHILVHSRRSDVNCAVILTLVSLIVPILGFLFAGGPGLIPWLMAMGMAFLLGLLINYVYIYLLRKVQHNLLVYVLILIFYPIVADRLL